jgi:dTMP kinase
MFITFEGVEGSGKSLQIQRAESYLLSRGIPCLLTREPGGTGFGLALRRVLLDESGPARTPIGELLLYLADRHQHLREIIEPAVRGGVVVLCDRYHDATRAYQGGARGIPLEVIDSLAAILQIPDPDVTLLLDIPAELALTRARIRNQSAGSASEEGRFEAEDLSFHQSVRAAYLDLARRFPARIQVVDASGTPDEVFARITPLLDQWTRR